MIRKVWKFSWIIAMLLVFAACETDDEVDEPLRDPGTFEAEVTGDVEYEIEGSAQYAEYTHPETDDAFFAMSLESDDGQSFRIWFVRGSEFEGPDTYHIQEFDIEGMGEEWVYEVEEFVSFALNELNEEAEMYISNSGSITIDEAPENNLEGDFEFTAIGFEIENPEEFFQVTIEGEYNSEFSEIQFPEFE